MGNTARRPEGHDNPLSDWQPPPPWVGPAPRRGTGRRNDKRATGTAPSGVRPWGVRHSLPPLPTQEC